ncbi:hypothetical protein FHX74_000828 [Friedmanniella endophytica]|uniref:PknH-like extracellular domain-containing protein n=1 Tax=Microlunatus kandeliicorticis TaxID=1759536 RepID=A0A7W3IQ75_9ACTN|nr:hypothetical protein [Microlunatus kandeliicorticis]MBA8793234.1 hypothetical protein [Microlunatus kandeliicorticis]
MSSGSTPPDGPDADETPGEHAAAEHAAEHDTDQDTSGAPAPGDQPTSRPTTARDRRDRPDLARRRHPDSPVRSARRRWLAGVIAALVVIALGIGITVVALRQHGATATAPPTGSAPATPSATAEAGLGADDLLTPALARTILPGAAWRVTSDQTGTDASTSRAACLSPEATAQAPDPTRVLTRSLGTTGGTASPTPTPAPSSTTSSSAASSAATPSAPATGPDRNVPVVLHQALAFADASAATETYATFARALGNCDLAASYLSGAAVVTGLGDQSAAVQVSDAPHDVDRTVVINRTGTVVNVIDLVTRAGTSEPLKAIDAVVDALATLTDRQCTDAHGICASLVRVTAGPPPAAGDQPGLLALADIPQPQSGTGTWAGLQPGKPDDLVTSGCEDVDFGKVDAQRATARSYLLSDKPPGMPASFGLDEAVFTFADAKDATGLADELNKNLKSCKERQLTASVEGGDQARGLGAGGVGIEATTWVVSQKVSDTTTSRFRVGVAVAGDQVVYTFLPTGGKFDLTDDQWMALTIRAAQRATQAT